MTLLAEKLRAAGAQTAEARLMVLACEALRESDGMVEAAAIRLRDKLDADWWVAREVWLLPYLRERQRDMRGANSLAGPQPRLVPAVHAVPRPPRRSLADRKAAVAEIVKAIKFGHMTSDGRDWASVGAHELDGMARDGALAKAIKDRIGVLSNSQRFMTLGDLMKPEAFEQTRRDLA